MSRFLSDLSRLGHCESRSISAENPTGERAGGARDIPEDPTHPAARLGQGWKVSPNRFVEPGEVAELALIEGPGTLRSLWMTCLPETLRFFILRCYWDDEETPSVESPLGDFFCCGWSQPSYVAALPINVNPAGGYNAYFPMPFARQARITIENIGLTRQMLFYQINYELGAIPEDSAYFHAHFRRTNPLVYKESYVLADNIKGHGHYVGTFMGWQPNNNYWWGEGEIKFYLDGDEEFPTICGTGTEDYFGGAWSFEEPKGVYKSYTNLYCGLNQVINPGGAYQLNQRFGMYRFHITDPIYFKDELRITMQALGWRTGFKEFLPLKDDISSVVYWYQAEPHNPLPPLPSRDDLEVI